MILRRLGRVLAATALVASGATLAFASPASATATLSFADDGNGGVTVTYSRTTEMVAVEFWAAGTTCATNTPGALMVLTYPGGPPGSELGPSPATLTFGDPVWGIGNTPGPTTIPAGTFTLCGLNVTGQAQVLDQIEFTFADPNTTTTTTSTTSTTTTTASADPVTPSFTG